MTPAVVMLKRSNEPFVLHEYAHDPRAHSYGLEAAEKLGVPAERVFKTLVVQADDKALLVAVLPVDGRLELKQLASAAGAKRVAMADPALVERTTGYVLGGVSPLGQKKRLRTFIEASAQGLSTVFVSAGRRGLEIELSPQVLQRLTEAEWATLTAGG